MIVAFASYGNDSLALLQWLSEAGEADVVAVYSDTGWASAEWPARVDAGEEYARGLGFETARIPSEGFSDLARRKRGFPRNGLQWCTAELKIKPALAWLEGVDPGRDAICAVGVRREESARRAQWPEYVEESDRHGGRSLWSPLVRLREAERNALLVRSGFDPLPSRSQECCPCVNASRADLRMVQEGRIQEIEALEGEIGHNLFRPYRHQGAAGIREVIRWANSARGKHVAAQISLCDSGFCGD